jgi:hypothetical protein
MSILSNEKYSGNALLQKGYTVDFLTKKKKKNEGEVPQYFVENSHPGIVTTEVFDLVQTEIKRRKSQGGKHSRIYPFFGRVICGECAGVYGSKVWHSTSKYRRTIWQCNKKFKNGTKCKTPHLNEDVLKGLFVEAFNRLYEERAGLADDYEDIIAALTDTVSLDKKAVTLADECAVVMELIRKAIEENAHTAQDQDEYHRRHEGLVARYETAKNQLDDVNDEKQNRNAKREAITRFIAELGVCGGALAEFDERLWYATVDSVTVSETTAAFTFKDGTVIETEI